MPDRPRAIVTIRFTTGDPMAMMRDWSQALGLDDIATLLELQAGELEVEVVNAATEVERTRLDPFTAPVIVTVRRLLTFFPNRGWQMTLKGTDWLTLDFEPAWGEEATPENGARQFAIWLNTAEAYRVGEHGAVTEDPIPLDLMDPEKDRL